MTNHVHGKDLISELAPGTREAEAIMEPQRPRKKKGRPTRGGSRRAAKSGAAREKATPQPSADPLKIAHLSHNLQAHEEELETQNRQLIESQRLLEDSRDRYASLYDFAPIPYVTFCGHGVIREINLTGATLLGQTRDRLIDRPFVLMVAPGYRRVFLDHLSRCRNGKALVHTEVVLLGAGKAMIPVELRTNGSTSIRDSRPVFHSVLIDLTERRRLEQEREELRATTHSERLLRAILQTLPVAVRVVGPAGQTLLFNEACRTLWGIAPGSPLPPWDHQKGWDAHTRSPLQNEQWPIAQALHGQGELLQKKIHIQAFDSTLRVVLQSAVPLLDEAGSISGAVEVTEDLTRLLAAQDTARTRQEQLEAAFDAAHLGFWDWDLVSDRVSWSGPFQALFAPPGAAAGTSADFYRRIHPDDLKRVKESGAKARETRSTLEQEFRVIEPGGAIRWLLARGRFAYEGERPTRMTGVLTDVTERKTAEIALRKAKDAAEQASRLKDDFLATVSHELRTPLSAILLWAHLARNTMKEEPQRTKALDTIVENAKAQSQIVDDLLDISRGIAGKLRLDPKPASLVLPVRAAIESVRPSADARQVELKVEIVPDLPPVRIDADRMQQVVWNLLSNAIKFTPPGGRVSVGVALHQDPAGTHVVRLSVTDTGSGIPPEFLPHIFDRFRQAESGTTRAYGGLGLGLAIARELTQMHGGTIRAHSEGPGRGTTFTVDLPLRIQALADRPPDAPAEPRESLEGVDVLIVEDDTDTRKALGQLLESAGAKVRTAPSAAAAVEAFCARAPDALVSDIAMPEQDGYVLMRRLRQIESDAIPSRRGSRRKNGAARHHVPAVALTAHARPEDRAKAIDAGFQAHLAKPVDPAHLISAVAALCSPGHRPESTSKRG